MLFTKQDDEFIIAHRPGTPCKVIAAQIGKTQRQVIDRVKYLCMCGRDIPTTKQHRYTAKDEAFILENYNMLPAIEISKILGVGSKAAVISFAHRLAAEGKVFAHTAHSQDELERFEIRDGYETVPWHMRQSTRCQYYLTLDYSA